MTRPCGTFKAFAQLEFATVFEESKENNQTAVAKYYYPRGPPDVQWTDSALRSRGLGAALNWSARAAHRLFVFSRNTDNISTHAPGPDSVQHPVPYAVRVRTSARTSTPTRAPSLS